MTFICFLKFFDKREYAEEFLNGKLYCNTVSYFKNLEGDNYLRSDSNEGCVFSVSSEKIELVINDMVISSLVGPVRVLKPWMDCLNVFSMSSFNVNDNYGELSKKELLTILDMDNRLQEFGNYAVLIKDCNGFLNRVSTACKKDGVGCEFGLIKYIDFNLDFSIKEDKKALFQKSSTYSYQREARLLFDVGDDHCGFIEVCVGSLSDIGILLEGQKIRNKLYDYFSSIIK